MLDRKAALKIRNRFRHLWHYTLPGNTPGICTNGILPRSQLHPSDFTDVAFATALANRGRFGALPCSICAAEHSISDFVPLFIEAKNPMTSRMRDEHGCLLKVDFARLFGDTTHIAIADGNVASGPHKTKIYTTPEGADRLDWTILKSERWNLPDASESENKERARRRAAEVLVTPRVRPEAIIEIRVSNQDQRQRVLSSLAGIESHPPCWVAEDNFFS